MDDAKRKHEYHTIIIGGGFAGIIAAKSLKDNNIDDFLLIEKSNQLGGVWRDNLYPGCGCDIPSYLYSIKDYTFSAWSKKYAGQSEILQYINTIAASFNLSDHLQFNTIVKELNFNSTQKKWIAQLTSGKCYKAKHIILATGALNTPKTPNYPGLSQFKGLTLHTAKWNPQVNLNGKSVAVVGTGASAIQLIPNIADKLKLLHVIQRSAPWILPKNNHSYSRIHKLLFSAIPFTQKIYRNRLHKKLESWLLHFKAQDQVYKKKEKQALKFISSSVKSEKTVRKLTPDYALGCKRILFSDDYYPTFNMPHVYLRTDGISHITEKGIAFNSGESLSIDIIIWATGFYPNAALSKIVTNGLTRLNLFRTWLKKGPKLLKGVAAHGFPQLHLLCGPNTGIAHNSVLMMFEAQMQYILQSISASDKHPNHILNVKSSSQDQWFDSIQHALEQSIWNQGQCQSWYLNAKGKNYSLYPHTVSEYQQACQNFDLNDYQLLEPGAQLKA